MEQIKSRILSDVEKKTWMDPLGVTVVESALEGTREKAREKIESDSKTLDTLDIPFLDRQRLRWGCMLHHVSEETVQKIKAKADAELLSELEKDMVRLTDQASKLSDDLRKMDLEIDAFKARMIRDVRRGIKMRKDFQGEAQNLARQKDLIQQQFDAKHGEILQANKCIKSLRATTSSIQKAVNIYNEKLKGLPVDRVILKNHENMREMNENMLRDELTLDALEINMDIPRKNAQIQEYVNDILNIPFMGNDNGDGGEAESQRLIPHTEEEIARARDEANIQKIAKAL